MPSMTDTADPAGFSLDRFLCLPRVEGLRLSPDGRRLVTSVARPNAKATGYVRALWELDPDGDRRPRRLTRSAKGESGAAFLPDGGLLFLSARPDPDAAGEEREEVPALWLLPPGGGEAAMLLVPPGGVDAVAVARDSGAVVLAASSFPGAKDWDADRERAKARKDAEITAQLFTEYPIRLWDHYVGPRERRIHVAPAPDGEEPPTTTDLTPESGRALDGATFDVTPDGATVVTGWWHNTDGDPLRRFADLVAIDAAEGSLCTIGAGECWYEQPACSPDGRWVVCTRESLATLDEPYDSSLWLFDLERGEGRDLTPGFDLWPAAPVWAPDSRAVFFTADSDGRTLPFRVDLDGDRSGGGQDSGVRRLAAEGTYSDLCPSPDGNVLYALRSTVDHPPRAVVLDAAQADGEPRELPTPGDDIEAPGRVERVEATAGDGTAVRSWLVLPPDASPKRPAPLLVMIHGGPNFSWSGWHWRWNPHLLAARGYAVLLPDPGLSTGYGQDFIRRGWGRWGDEPYTDLMAATDAAVDRPDVDGSRTAAMGGSFGGYMANWIAGHTDRFDAIVSHAGLWDLLAFHGTTDQSFWWAHQFGDIYTDTSRYEAATPNRHVARIRTPMLVTHGELDHRVPISEALTLWNDLCRHHVEGQFLYFPDEHHWILKPQNARLFYETMFAFLDHHVLGLEWTRPNRL
jgi:dipeptidyl aminopeptidase/acylaminoacyl peptidase